MAKFCTIKWTLIEFMPLLWFREIFLEKNIPPRNCPMKAGRQHSSRVVTTFGAVDRVSIWIISSENFIFKIELIQKCWLFFELCEISTSLNPNDFNQFSVDINVKNKRRIRSDEQQQCEERNSYCEEESFMEKNLKQCFLSMF